MHPFLYNKQVLTCLYYPSIFVDRFSEALLQPWLKMNGSVWLFWNLHILKYWLMLFQILLQVTRRRVWKLVKYFFSHVMNDMVVSFSNCFPGTYTVLTIFSWALLLSGCLLSCSLACVYKCIFDKWLLVKLFFSLWLYKCIFDNLIRMSWFYVGKYFQTIKCPFSFFTVNFAACLKRFDKKRRYFEPSNENNHKNIFELLALEACHRYLFIQMQHWLRWCFFYRLSIIFLVFHRKLEIYF